MIKLLIRFVVVATFPMALTLATPVLAAGGGGGGGGGDLSDVMNPKPPNTNTNTNTNRNTKSAPATQSTHRAKKSAKQSFLSDPTFIQGYRAAYDTIYERNDYNSAIEQLRALGHDDYANVANLIGYSYRKLGDYKLSQVWYERALQSDPNHVLTWNYYGFWQLEQGNREQAEYHLSRIAAICGTDCYEYRTLAEALEKPAGAALVY
jgi:tetratricopeptide (TPR) repeat protein